MKVIIETDWAYPTSPNAEGHPKGCYSVTRTEINGTDIDVRTLKTGFPTLAEAEAFARSLIKSEPLNAPGKPPCLPYPDGFVEKQRKR